VQVPAQGLEDLELKVMDLNAGEDGEDRAHTDLLPEKSFGLSGGAKCEKRLMMVV